MSLLDSIIASYGSANIVSQEHDVAKTSVAGMDGTRQQRIDFLKGRGYWDEGEYGISRAEQITKLEQANTPAAQEVERVAMVSRAIQRHSLDATTCRVAAAFARKPGWHKLGTVFDAEFQTADLRNLPELNYELTRERMAYRGPGGDWTEDDDTYAVIRSDTRAKLGTVGSKTKVIQNWQVWDMLDKVIGQFGARYESAGSIYGGKQAWVQIHLPRQAFQVGNHTHVEPYALYFKRNDGSGCDALFPTEVRAECANTTAIACRGSKGKGLRIRHTGSIETKIADAQRALGLAVEGMEGHKEEVQAMARTVLAQPLKYYVNDVLDAALDITAADVAQGADLLSKAIAKTSANQELVRKSIQNRIDNRKDILEDILRRHESNTNDGARGTVWGAYNAVSESADWGKLGGRYTGDAHKRASRQFVNIVEGEAAESKQIAYQQALALAR